MPLAMLPLVTRETTWRSRDREVGRVRMGSHLCKNKEDEALLIKFPPKPYEWLQE